MKITRLFLLLLILLAMIPNRAVAGDTIVCTTAQIDSLVDARVQQVLAVEIERSASAAANEKYIQHDNEMKNRYTWLGILIALAGAFIPYLVNKGYEKRLEKKEEEVDEGLKTAEKEMLRRLAKIAAENKRKIKDEIETRTVKLDKEIQEHDKKLKEVSDQIETMVKNAKISEEESAKYVKLSALITQAIAENELNKKIELYTEAIKINPNIAGLYINRGIAYAHKGEYDKAIKENFDEAIRININDAEAYYNRGFAYYKQDEYVNAIKNYDKAIDINENYAEAYNNRGIAYGNLGKYRRAITENFMKAIELNPNYAEAYYNLGLTYDKVGDCDKAIESYNKAIELNPNYVDAYINLGSTYCDKGEYDKAIENCDKAISAINNPICADAYNSRGIAYAMKGDYDKAIKDNNEAIRINPNNDNAYILNAFILFIQKKYQDALPLANKAIELNDKKADYYDKRCDIFAGLENITAAIEDAQKGLEIAKGKGQTKLAKKIEEKIKILQKAMG